MTAAATLPLLRAGRWYESRDFSPVPGGMRLCLAPEIMIRDDAARLRRTRGGWRSLAASERQAILREAADMFEHGRVWVEGAGYQDPGRFASAMGACAGLPPVLVRRWSAVLRERLAEFPRSLPDDKTVTLVSLPANTFMCLEAVFEALLVSGAVWIRPSRREPLSSARLLGALLAAGWPAERLGYYPTAPAVLPALVRQTTRQIVYGGDGVAAELAGAGSALDLRGPGRACAILGTEPPRDPDRLAAWLADLIAGDAGRLCTNVCVIATTGDIRPVARRLAGRLDSISLGHPDPRLPQASVPDSDARRVARFLEERLLPGGFQLTRRPFVVRAGGQTYLAPTLIQIDHVDHRLVGGELPFPFAVAVSTDAAGISRLTGRSRFVHAEHAAARLEGVAR